MMAGADTMMSVATIMIPMASRGSTSSIFSLFEIL